MLYSSLQPLVILTKLMQSKSSLISSYGPILWAVTSHIEFIGSKMDLAGRPFDVTIPLQKVEKYINSIKDKYPIVRLASVFHFDGRLFLEDLNIKVVDKLVELAIKIGFFETENLPW
ncbi:hypothetical protein C6P45_000747 [Maudiozyma exigua]|uniref:Uncharacterized protein n=1 Tax=Maudiozyma exigua TaxID=34358 RepID=A0A9P6W674_MAUEX|nr:hypothetical protein C6P45_000747 [Kazachstania exigua]